MNKENWCRRGVNNSNWWSCRRGSWTVPSTVLCASTTLHAIYVGRFFQCLPDQLKIIHPPLSLRKTLTRAEGISVCVPFFVQKKKKFCHTGFHALCLSRAHQNDFSRSDAIVWHRRI